jgi:cytoplasmic iron level regulating protein YaaA (DUF328/UPF0246 family)
MKKITLISCVSKKLENKARAEDLYISNLFKLSLEYARKQNPDDIFILSAKYGLLALDDEIEPYDETLNTMKINQRKNWAREVVKQLKAKADLDKDHFIILAGKKYREFLTSHLKSYEIPLEGLSIGKQLKFLKNKVSHE